MPKITVEAPLHEKEEKLEQLIKSYEKALIAFSGGVDSAFLLHRSVALLGKENILAVTAASPIRPAAETEAACALAVKLGVPHRLIETAELSLENFLKNPSDRCFHCKEELCRQLKALAVEKSFEVIIDGANHDDLSDYRPGAAAVRAAGVRSPLQEAALTKAEIRALSRRYRLPTWNMPAESCLATRFPYGERLEIEKIGRVEQGESFLRSLGLKREIRLRSWGDSARIEVDPGEMVMLLERRREVLSRLQELGFQQVSLDLGGYTPAGGTGAPPLP